MAKFTAVGAKLRPITMMIGPVTTGGISRCKKPGPRHFTRAPSTT